MKQTGFKILLNVILLVLLVAQATAQSCPPTGGNQGGGQGSGGGNNPNDPNNNNNSGNNGTTIVINRVHSSDPNDILGPKGFEDIRKWVSVKDKLSYRIRFENNPKFATAPAQNVFVYLPILPGLNINTMRVGSFGFGNYTFDVPDNVSYYSTRLDLRDSMGLYVDFTAGIDVVKNRLFWIFRSIDPVTGGAPSDALKGFLPVNDTAINRFNDTLPKVGEGYVTFLMNPRRELVTGDTTSAKATIIFDTNEEIPTNVWTNTVDAIAPASRINMATVKKDTINLFWSGQDDPGGAGIRDYSVYVSENGGPYTLYKNRISNTQEYFVGTPGNSYCFFTLGTDNTGNLESMKTSCDISAILAPDAALPLNWLYFRGRQQDEDILLNWGTANERNTDFFVVERSIDGRQFAGIGTVPAKGGLTANYTFTDHDGVQLRVKILYYRLRQLDKNGKLTYSSIVAIRLDDNLSAPIVKVYPNPFNQVLTLLINTPASPLPADRMEIYSSDGKLLYRKGLSGRQNGVPVTLSDLPALLPGIYVLKTYLNGATETLKIIKQ